MNDQNSTRHATLLEMCCTSIKLSLTRIRLDLINDVGISK